jgi:hypothetical protein
MGTLSLAISLLKKVVLGCILPCKTWVYITGSFSLSNGGGVMFWWLSLVTILWALGSEACFVID